MRTLIVIGILGLCLVAAWQFHQRKTQQRTLASLQAQLDRLPGIVNIVPTLVPEHRQATEKSQPTPQDQTVSVEQEKPSLDESWSTLGVQCGAGMRRLMALRDRMPENERMPLDQVLEVITTGELTASDPALRAELISEAELLMRSMIGFMANLGPEHIAAMQNGEGHPHAGDFGAGFVTGALELDPEMNASVLEVLNRDEEGGNEALQALLTPAQNRALIELVKGRRFEELSEAEREEPVDLLGHIRSFF